MSVDLKATTFTGQYGNCDDFGNLIHVVVNTSQTTEIIKNTSVIFCIDISASMEKSIPIVKSSLLAFRDAVVGKSHKVMEQYTEDERDELFRKSINLTLITFSIVAKIVWSPKSEDRFEDVVLGLDVVSMTNMGDALRLAFETIKSNDEVIFNWIVVMTDGESNEGPCRTSSSFQQMVNKNKPINSKIISIGYGDRFDPEVLYNIGTFVYIEDDEKIPVVFGNLTEEIMNTVGFNCNIFFEQNNNKNNKIEIDGIDDEIEFSAYDDEPGRLLAGNDNTDTLCYNKTYDWLYLSTSINNSSINNFQDIIIVLKYTNFDGVEIIKEIKPSQEYKIRSRSNSQEYKINIDSDSDKIKELYFATETKKLIYRLYRITQKIGINVIKEEIKFIENILDSWTDPISERYKDEILKMIENINNFKLAKHRNSALNSSVGSGYGTRINSSYVTSILSSCNHYVTSPHINKNI
jgi:hypothetical protein